MKIITIFASILMLLSMSRISSASEIVLDEFGTPKSSYVSFMGLEYPGAKADFSWVEQGYKSKGAVKIAYDFSEGGQYCQLVINRRWFAGNERGISFYAKGQAGEQINVRITDSTHQTHQYMRVLESWEWVKVEIPFEPTLHWGGANDGVVHGPVSQILIGPNKSNESKGSLIIDDLAVQSESSVAEINNARREYFLKTAELSIFSSQLGGIFSLTDKKDLLLSVSDVPSDMEEVCFALNCTDAYGKKSNILPARVVLSKKTGYTRHLALSAGVGYYDVSFSLLSSGKGTEGKVNGKKFSFAVIPDSTTKDNPVNSAFGVNTHFNQSYPQELGRIVKKVGIGWIRDGEASLADIAVQVAVANKLCYLPCFTFFGGPGEKNWVGKGDPNRKNDPDNWDFSDVAERTRKYAEKYGKHIEYYDLDNEPQGEWSSVFGGDWSGGPWVNVFVKYGKQLSKAIKAGDPDAKVLWEDIDVLIWYKQFFNLDVDGRDCDVISPHPYNLHRERPLPEDQPALSQLAVYHQFTKEHSLPWDIWSGEVGFASFKLTDATPTIFYSPNTEVEQSEKLVRMMLVQIANGVDKVFWYDLRNDGFDPVNPEHNFGLIRYDYSPKPAIVA